LPNVRYVGINFTMPNVLWPIFRRNRHLLHDLPALAASVIQQYLKVKHHVRGLVMVVPHTFGRKLNFHPHLHTLVSSGGLRDGDNCWVNVDEFNKKALMEMWKFAVTTYLRDALAAQVLQANLSDRQLRQILAQQYERRWWIIHIARFASKDHFVYYAGRYIRRPPIAQHRFTKIEDREVCFMRKDTRSKKWLVTRYGIEDFVLILADHIPDRYRHAIRYFGLLAPGTKGRTDRGVFAVLRQTKRPCPVRLSWAASIKRDFGRDPLLDNSGKRMSWVRRAAPQPA
jgi:hypothetical protein